MHPYIFELQIKENQRRIDEEIKHYHLLGLARRGDTGPGRRILNRLGGALIDLGWWMKRRCESVGPTGTGEFLDRAINGTGLK